MGNGAIPNFRFTEFYEVRYSPALGKKLPEAFARYAAPDFRGGDFY